MLVVLKVLYIIVVILLIAIILLQEPRSSGFSSALGGMEQIFGVRGVPTLLTKITAVLFALFLILSLAISVYIGRTVYRPKTAVGKSVLEGKGVPAVHLPQKGGTTK